MPVTVCAASGTSPVSARVTASAIFCGSCVLELGDDLQDDVAERRATRGEVQAVLVEHELEGAEPLALRQRREAERRRSDA